MSLGKIRLVFAAVVCGGVAGGAWAGLPPVIAPIENPVTENKRVLGKVLFWDEQLSSDNTVACATCHSPGNGGAEPRLVRSPGPDGVLNTADDTFGSGGVVRSNTDFNYVRDAVFGTLPQQTGRAANPVVNAAYFPEAFWDGRAPGEFVDPQTGEISIAYDGALESQSVGPPVSGVEMAHPGWNWGDLTAKLASARPLDLARGVQPDVGAALAANPTYPDLFRAAFGDPQITARRVAFAIATYERTLISDQTPWDAFMAGNTGAMTPTQQLGWEKFQGSGQCIACHTDPLFTDTSYHNIGVRPIAEDMGRMAISADPLDAGAFKTPGLRNSGLKRTFMHNGMFQSLGQVMAYYRQLPSAPAAFPDNMSLLINDISLTPEESGAVQDFVANALTDPRVANQQFPFDRLTLAADRPEDRCSVVASTGEAGSGGVVPTIIVQSPPMIGNDSFRVGLAGALGGAQATLGVSTSPPVNGRITPGTYVGTLYATGGGAGAGVATVHWPLLASQFSGGTVLYVQWFVTDPGAAGGVAASSVGRLPLFCGLSGCPSPCDSIDFNRDGLFPDTQDIADFIAVFSGGVCDGQQPGDAPCNSDIDYNNDTLLPDVADIQSFLSVFSGGPCL